MSLFIVLFGIALLFTMPVFVNLKPLYYFLWMVEAILIFTN